MIVSSTDERTSAKEKNRQYEDDKLERLPMRSNTAFEYNFPSLHVDRIETFR